MPFRRWLLLVAFVFSTAPPAPLVDRVYATTITFDDINVPSVGYSNVPSVYADLSWSSGWYVAKDSFYKTYGNSYGSPSGENAAFNGYGLRSIGFSSQSTFDFSSVKVAGWGFSDQASTQYSAKSITIEGYRDGSLVSAKTLPLSSAGYKWLQADFKGVNEIRFISSDNGKWWLADDISLNQSVQPQIARTSLDLKYPFGSSLPISLDVLSAPDINKFPSPDKLTSTNLADFVKRNGDQFDLGTKLVLQTLTGVAKLPVIGVPVGKGIDAILNPSEPLKQLSTKTHQMIQGINFTKNMWEAGFLLDQAGGQLGNLSNSQFIDFTQSLLESINIGSELADFSTGPVLQGLSTAFSAYGDVKDVFNFSSAVFAKDPYTALLVANNYIWYDLVSNELKVLGLDPPDLSYKSVYIPASKVAIEIPDLGNESLQVLGEQMLAGSLTYYQILDALNVTFDRYTTAYLAGDASSATLQLQAWLFYLNTLYGMSDQLEDLINEFQVAFAANEELRGIDKDEILEAYNELFLALTGQSPSEEVMDYLSTFLGVDADSWQMFTQEFSSLSPALSGLIDGIPGGKSELDAAKDFLVNFVALGNSSGNSVPEPNTLVLCLAALLALLSGRVTSRLRLHTRTR